MTQSLIRPVAFLLAVQVALALWLPTLAPVVA